MATSPPHEASHRATAHEAFRTTAVAHAILSYSKALELDPCNHVHLSNRSAAYLAQGELVKACKDAAECVDLAPRWVEGFYRWALALKESTWHGDAVAVLEAGMWPDIVIRMHGVTQASHVLTSSINPVTAETLIGRRQPGLGGREYGQAGRWVRG